MGLLLGCIPPRQCESDPLPNSGRSFNPLGLCSPVCKRQGVGVANICPAGGKDDVRVPPTTSTRTEFSLARGQRNQREQWKPQAAGSGRKHLQEQTDPTETTS